MENLENGNNSASQPTYAGVQLGVRFAWRIALGFVLLWTVYVWAKRLPDDSLVVIYFGRPADTLKYLIDERHTLIVSSFWCVFVAVVSLSISGILAIVLLAIGLWSDGRLSAIERLAASLQTVPVLVIVTLSLLVETQIAMLFNLSPAASSYCVLPVTIALMFPPLANGAGAIRRMPIQLKELLRIWGAPSLWKIRRVYLPLAIPDILTGVRASSTWAVGATLIAEGLLNGVSGDSNTLGHFLVRPFSSSASPGRTPAVILIATVLGFLVYLLFVGIQRYWESRLMGDSAQVEVDLGLRMRESLHGNNEELTFK
jgi:ABC-type nitrate/sulfonate/bicarbonate transport system permease component